MELLSTITAICTIADKAISVVANLAKLFDKKPIATLLKDIGNLLITIHKDLSSDVYPHRHCGELYFFLNNLKEKVTKYDKNFAEQLDNSLHEAYQVERMFGQLSTCTEEEKKLNLSKLEEAAGIFIAAGALIEYD